MNFRSKNFQKLFFFLIFFFSFFGLTRNSEAASNVYYSISPYGTGNLLSGGSPTIVIDASGNATLTLSGATMAVDAVKGLAVEYNSTKSFVDSITDNTHFHLTTALGANASSQTSTAVTSIHYEYSSLGTAAQGFRDSSHINNNSLVLADVIVNLYCYRDFSGNTADSISGQYAINFWQTVTDATHYVVIQGDWSGGKWSNDYYRIEHTSTSGTQSTYFNNNNIFLNNIQINFTSTYASTSGIVQAANVEINRCFIKASFSGSGGGTLINTEGPLTVKNTIITGAAAGSDYYGGIWTAGGSIKFYNNVVYGCRYGILNWVGTWDIKNCAVFGNTYDFYAVTGVDNCASDDATGTNAVNLNENAGGEWDSSFIDYANGDFHLKTGSSLINAGTDLSAEGFSDDIDGQTRSVGAWDIGADQLPKPVYYSVGQNATDHSSGGNVSITSGVATFTVAQVATNLGVGDRLTAGGNVYYLASKNSTTSWNVITATGGIPADLGSTAVTSIAHTYTTLAGAIAGASTLLGTSDLVTGNYILNIPCYYDTGADETAVTINGYTTGANNYIKIYTPNNTTTECNQSQRHSGKWDDGKYRLEKTATGSSQSGIQIRDEYVRIDGLQIWMINSGYQYCDSIATNVLSSATNDIYVSNNILCGTISGAYSSGGIVDYYAQTNLKIYNNIIYDFTTAGSSGISIGNPYNNYQYVYNNTIYNCAIGYNTNSSQRVTTINNIYQSGSTGSPNGFNGTFNSASDYNISDVISDAPSPSFRTNLATAVNFVDIANYDFHLSPADIFAIGNGTDLSGDAYFLFSTDIDGDTRSRWDIGADEMIKTMNKIKGTVKLNGSVKFK